MIAMSCESGLLNNFFYIVKNIMNIIMIVSPILAILSFTLTLFKMATDPENKKLIKNLKNSFTALLVIFFIPMIVTLVMTILGESTSISSCYNNASRIDPNSSYTDLTEDERQSITKDKDDYEYGIDYGLDFSCHSNILASQFSCDTIPIVERHMNDFNSSNFDSKMASYGGYKNYIKSLGGVFAEYADYNGKVETVEEFQKAAEYVWGIMTLYGVDYANYQPNRYTKWGDSSETSYGNGQAASDAFYPTGTNNGYRENSISSTVDDVFSGHGVGMTTNCALGVQWTYRKAGMIPSDLDVYQFQKLIDRGGKIITNASDLQPGDMVHYFHSSLSSSDKYNPSVWWNRNWFHINLVGERYDDENKIYYYDAGHKFTDSRNYKYSRNIGEKPYEHATDWVGVRIYNFK